jgi:anaerobic selenocysteine-containing dehydrogenase
LGRPTLSGRATNSTPHVAERQPLGLVYDMDTVLVVGAHPEHVDDRAWCTEEIAQGDTVEADLLDLEGAAGPMRGSRRGSSRYIGATGAMVSSLAWKIALPTGKMEDDVDVSVHVERSAPGTRRGTMTDTRLVSTFCRICEPLCPLVAETDGNGTLLALHPDRDHPVSGGFACHKGTSFHQVHHDPNRLNHPLRRTNPTAAPTGQFEAVSWNDACAEIGERLRRIRAVHGTEAVGCYWGNPLAYTSTGIATVYTFWAKMQSTRLFGGLTQDLSNKFAAMDAMFGVEAMFPAPDLYRTDYFLCLGSDPSGSHLTAVSVPDAIDAIRGIRARGGGVTFVNPRRIRAVELGLGDHLPIRPDTDVYFLAAMLTEIDRIGGWDDDVLRRHGRNVDGLRDFIRPYDADSVARVTGLDAEDIRRTARAFSAAPSAIAHMGTGGNMGRQGTLVYWLLQMLNLVTGNLGRAGGGLLRGTLPAQRFDELPERFFDSPVGPVRHVWGHLPGNLLADYIEAPVDPLRALIVVGGNPIMAIPGEDRLRRAFPQLELVVTMDLYRSATADLSHFVLPVSDWLERADYRSGGVAVAPTAQYTDAVVAPVADRAEEWWILARIEQELGLPSALDGDGVDFPRTIFDVLAAAAGTTIDELRSLPSNTKVLGPPTSIPLEDAVAYTDARIDCCPPSFGPLLDRARNLLLELEGEPPDGLKLIQWRNRRQHNTWGKRLMPRLREGPHSRNPVFLHPDDATARSLAEGDPVTVRSSAGSVETVVGFDAALRRGVVALSHGYGERTADDAPDAEVGVNVNRLLPSGPGSYELYSSMAFMVGIPVEIVARTGSGS